MRITRILLVVLPLLAFGWKAGAQKAYTLDSLKYIRWYVTGGFNDEGRFDWTFDLIHDATHVVGDTSYHLFWAERLILGEGRNLEDLVVFRVIKTSEKRGNVQFSLYNSDKLETEDAKDEDFYEKTTLAEKVEYLKWRGGWTINLGIVPFRTLLSDSILEESFPRKANLAEDQFWLYYNLKPNWPKE